MCLWSPIASTGALDVVHTAGSVFMGLESNARGTLVPGSISDFGDLSSIDTHIPMNRSLEWQSGCAQVNWKIFSLSLTVVECVLIFGVAGSII